MVRFCRPTGDWYLRTGDTSHCVDVLFYFISIQKTECENNSDCMQSVVNSIVGKQEVIKIIDHVC